MNQAAEQYHARASAYVRANPGMHVMVRGNAKGEDRQRQKEIAAAWFTYFHVRGQTGTIATFRSILNGAGSVMFPCDCPTLFDMSYVPPVHVWREPQGASDSRSDVSHVVERTLDSLRRAVPRGRKPVPKDHLKAPEKTPSEWIADYQANPPPIPVFSDEFRDKFGLPRKPPRTEAAA
jgi:hypothetical protein